MEDERLAPERQHHPQHAEQSLPRYGVDLVPRLAGVQAKVGWRPSGHGVLDVPQGAGDRSQAQAQELSGLASASDYDLLVRFSTVERHVCFESSRCVALKRIAARIP